MNQWQNYRGLREPWDPGQNQTRPEIRHPAVGLDYMSDKGGRGMFG